MNRLTCGYHAHYCNPGSVYFISRYQDTNDYCVGGKRISVSDSGQVSADATTLELHAIYGYELRKYQEYLEWRASSACLSVGEPSPFNAGITRTVRP